MKKPIKPTMEEVLESPDGQLFVERLANILLQQVEHEALTKTGQNADKTQKTPETA